MDAALEVQKRAAAVTGFDWYGDLDHLDEVEVALRGDDTLDDAVIEAVGIADGDDGGALAEGVGVAEGQGGEVGSFNADDG